MRVNNDLISKNKLLEEFRNTITENSGTFDWLNMISRQPTVSVEEIINRIDGTVPGLTNMQIMQISNILESEMKG